MAGQEGLSGTSAHMHDEDGVTAGPTLPAEVGAEDGATAKPLPLTMAQETARPTRAARVVAVGAKPRTTTRRKDTMPDGRSLAEEFNAYIAAHATNVQDLLEAWDKNKDRLLSKREFRRTQESGTTPLAARRGIWTLASCVHSSVV